MRFGPDSGILEGEEVVTHDAELASHAHRIVHIRDGATVTEEELEVAVAAPTA